MAIAWLMKAPGPGGYDAQSRFAARFPLRIGAPWGRTACKWCFYSNGAVRGLLRREGNPQTENAPALMVATLYASADCIQLLLPPAVRICTQSAQRR